MPGITRFPAGGGKLGLRTLGNSITLNGTTVSSSDNNGFRYEGRDATASGWPGKPGGSLALTANVGQFDPLYSGRVANPSADPGVFFTQYSQVYTGNAGAHAAGTDDVWISLLYQSAGLSAANQQICSTNNQVAPNLEYRLIGSATGYFRAFGTATINHAFSTAAASEWNFIEFYYNRDEASTYGLVPFVNGTQLPGRDFSANAADSLADAGGIIVGGALTFDEFEGCFAYVEHFHAPSWFAAGSGGVAEALAVHQARHNSLGLGLS